MPSKVDVEPDNSPPVLLLLVSLDCLLRLEFVEILPDVFPESPLHLVREDDVAIVRYLLDFESGVDRLVLLES